MKPILVVLAAGMGSRYGGLKQMDRLGENGEVLLDYSVFDALRAGFGKVVFIIRRDIEKDFQATALDRFKDSFPYEIAYQELDSRIPSGMAAVVKDRAKPWGTAHALLCAEGLLDAPFAVINSDDFYGKEAYVVLGRFLSNAAKEGAIVPYRLDQTLSPQGSVTRGVCGVKDGYLTSVDELKDIAAEDGKILYTVDGVKRELPADTPVSMNFWGFQPSVLPELKRYFDDFLTEQGENPKSECYIPSFVDHLIRTGTLDVRVLETSTSWFGVTYKEDRATAVQRIAELTRDGIYPTSLWE
ncbi:MAG: NTP transferase domain-containing protein [Treponema sp.]|jgi:dTDP-glucose pyrophosphorylase|nr:NTP transferase domain-containing protein [Treponema sp.]